MPRKLNKIFPPYLVTLRAAIDRSGLTYDEIEEKTDVARRTIVGWMECDTQGVFYHIPSMQNAEKVALVVGLKGAAFLGFLEDIIEYFRQQHPQEYLAGELVDQRRSRFNLLFFPDDADFPAMFVNTPGFIWPKRGDNFNTDLWNMLKQEYEKVLTEVAESPTAIPATLVRRILDLTGMSAKEASEFLGFSSDRVSAGRGTDDRNSFTLHSRIWPAMRERLGIDQLELGGRFMEVLHLTAARVHNARSLTEVRADKPEEDFNHFLGRLCNEYCGKNGTFDNFMVLFEALNPIIKAKNSSIPPITNREFFHGLKSRQVDDKFLSALAQLLHLPEADKQQLRLMGFRARAVNKTFAEIMTPTSPPPLAGESTSHPCNLLKTLREAAGMEKKTVYMMITMNSGHPENKRALYKKWEEGTAIPTPDQLGKFANLVFSEEEAPTRDIYASQLVSAFGRASRLTSAQGLTGR